MVSSIRILTDSERFSPFFFSVMGSTSEFEPVTEVYGPGFIDYDDAGMWVQYDRATQSVPYSTYRITLRKNIRASIQLNEIQFMVCNRSISHFRVPEYLLYSLCQSAGEDCSNGVWFHLLLRGSPSSQWSIAGAGNLFHYWCGEGSSFRNLVHDYEHGE